MSIPLTALTIAEALGNAQREGDGWKCTCPLASEHKNGDAHPSLHVNDTGDGKVLVWCPVHEKQQDRIIEALKARGLWPSGNGAPPTGHGAPAPTERKTAVPLDYELVQPIPADAPDLPRFIKWLAENKVAKPGRTVDPTVSIYNYRDQPDRHLFLTVRFNYTDDKGIAGKEIRPVSLWRDRSNGKLRWRSKWPPKRRPLYRIDKVDRHQHYKLVSVLEGEGKCDEANKLLATLGYKFVSFSAGSARVGESDFAPLADCRVAAWPDHDEVGFKAALQVADAVHSASLQYHDWPNREIWIIKPDPAWPPGHDIGDLIKSGWTAQQLIDYITKNSVPWRDFEPYARQRFPQQAAAPSNATSAGSGAAAPAAPQPLILVRANQEPPEPYRWLWRERLLRGKVNNLQGDPGDGKSVITMDIAARVTKGVPFPDGATCECGDVIILAGEDGRRDTISARLAVAGADLSRVHIWAVDRKEGEAPPTFPHDIDRLRLSIEEHRAVLVVIDPLENFLDDKLDPNSNPSIRKAMTALAWLAAITDACFLIVRHLSKDPNAKKAKYRGGGSIAITGAARANWHVGSNPEVPETKIFAPVKNNHTKPITSLGFRLVDAILDGTEIHMPKVEWLGEVTVTADDSLAAEAEGRRGPSPAKLQTAEEFLYEALSDGNYHDSEKVIAQAKGQGVRRTTLWRAKEKLKVKATRKGHAGAWVWYLPKS